MMPTYDRNAYALAKGRVTAFALKHGNVSLTGVPDETQTGLMIRGNRPIGFFVIIKPSNMPKHVEMVRWDTNDGATVGSSTVIMSVDSVMTQLEALLTA